MFPLGTHFKCSTKRGMATCHEVVIREKSGLEVVNADKFAVFVAESGSHKHIGFLSYNPLVLHVPRGKTFSAFGTRCLVHNHFTKRILNLILNRKKVLRRENEALDKQKPRQNCRVGMNSDGWQKGLRYHFGLCFAPSNHRPLTH